MNYIVTVLLILSIIFVLAEFHTKKASIVTLFVISYLLFFVLYGYSDVKHKIIPDDMVVVLTLLIIALSVSLVVILYKGFSKKFVYLNFSIVLQHIQSIRLKTVWYVFWVVTFIVIYFLATQGLAFQAMPHAGELASEKLQRTQYTNIRDMFILPGYSFVALVLSVRMKNHDIGTIRKVLFTIVIALVLIYLLLCGRRIFLYGVVLVGSFYLQQYKNLFSVKTLFIGSLSMVFLLMGSNLYQNLRKNAIASVVSGEVVMDKSIFEMMIDFDSTSDNFAIRQSVFSLDTKILRRQIEDDISYGSGEIFIQVLENSSPRLLNPWKKVVGEDSMISNITGLPATDLPTNMFGVILVDFGIFGVLVFVFVILFNFLLFNFLLKLVSKDSVAFLFIFTVLTTSIFQLESGFGAMIVLARTAIMMIILFKIAIYLKKQLFKNLKFIKTKRKVLE